MPSVRMNKFNIVANLNDKENILELLTKSRCFEICEAERAIRLDAIKDNARLAELNSDTSSGNRIVTGEKKPEESDFFSSAPIPLSKVKDTLTCSVFFVGGPKDANKGVFERLNCFIEEYPSNDGVLWGVICNKKDTAIVKKHIIKNELTIYNYDHKLSTNECIAENTQAVLNNIKDSSRLAKLKENQAKTQFAIDYIVELNSDARSKGVKKPLKKFQTNKFNKILEKQTNSELLEIDPASLEYHTGKKIKLSVRDIVTADDFENVQNLEQEILDICVTLEKNSLDKIAASEKIKELKQKSEELDFFSSVPIPLSKFKDTLTCSIFLIAGPKDANKSIFERLNCFIEEYPSNGGVLWGIVCSERDAAVVKKRISQNGLTICNYDYDLSASECIAENMLAISSLEKHVFELLLEGLELTTELTKIKTLFDIYGLEIEQIELEPKFYIEGNFITIEGWTPESASLEIKEKLEDNFPSIKVAIREAEDGDEPPTLLSNNPIVKPFQGVTTGYGGLKYGAINPTAVMSIFFFVFFGIMLADAGYGLIMAAGGLLMALFMKSESTTKKMLFMFAICGISGVAWGIVFGGVFGIEAIPYLWFDPLQNPIMMLAVSIILGAVHLLAGYTLKSVAVIRSARVRGLSKGAVARRIFDGLFYSLFMYTLFGAIAMIAFSMLLPYSTFPFMTVGIALIIITLGGILLTGGRHAKSIGGRIAGGLGGLYRLINVFSDVLSYARLFGLALASGAIAMAFNEIGSLLFGIPVAGILLGGIVLLILHVFNFALSALAAYVHNIRLSYVEFFGKFYESDGRYFEPIGENTKFVRFATKSKSVAETKSTENIA